MCRSAVGDLSLRRSVLCCEVCGGRQRQLAVSPKASKPYECSRKRRTLSRIGEKLTLELTGMCIYIYQPLARTRTRTSAAAADKGVPFYATALAFIPTRSDRVRALTQTVDKGVGEMVSGPGARLKQVAQ